jgi:hypothetical protein
MARAKCIILALGALVLGQLNPVGWLYWTVAERKLPQIKQQSLASPSPFEKISSATWIAESPHAFVVNADDPQAPVHFLVVPKQRVVSLLEAPPELLSEMLVLARDTAR